MLYAASVGNANDAELKNFGDAMKYHVDGLKGLFTFKFHNASNIVYLGLSALLYGLIALALIFLVVGIIMAVKMKRKIVIFGIVLVVLTAAIYMFGATGLPKYWLIINNRAPFKDQSLLLILVISLIISGALFALCSYISYLACIFEAIRNPKVEEKEEEEVKEETKQELPVYEEEDANDPCEPVMFEEIETEIPPEDKPFFDEVPHQEEKKSEEKDLDKNELADLIRNIVRDEINRNAPNNPNPGPLVVQYFGSMPLQQEIKEVKKEELKPVKEEKKEPVAEVAKDEEIQIHDKIIPEQPKAPEYKIVTGKKKEKPAPKEEEPEEKNKIIRIPFQTRMLNADDEMKKNYNELKNEILSYGVNSRVSNSGDAFRLHRKTYVKITIAGLSLKLYFALNPDDYKDSTIPVQNAGHKGIYEEIPLVFKVKSGLSMRRCKELIQTVMEKGGLEQGPIGDIDWVEKLKDQQDDTEED